MLSQVAGAHIGSGPPCGGGVGVVRLETTCDLQFTTWELEGLGAWGLTCTSRPLARTAAAEPSRLRSCNAQDVQKANFTRPGGAASALLVCHAFMRQRLRAQIGQLTKNYKTNT